MAKKPEKPKIVLERIYNVPLRREFQKVAKWRRTKKAVKALREFIIKHMKSDNVLIGRYANELLWKNGIKNPPHHIKVNASKDEKGKVTVELVELPGKAIREQKKQKELTKKKEEVKKKEEEEKKKIEDEKKKESEKKGEKTEEKPEEVKKEKDEKSKDSETKVSGPSEKKKAIEKEKLKELKKELPKQQMQKQPAIPKQVEQRPTAPKGQ